MIQDMWKCAKCGSFDMFLDAIETRGKTELPIRVACVTCRAYINLDIEEDVE